MRNKYPCIECCTGWGDGDGNSCRDTCKRLAEYEDNNNIIQIATITEPEPAKAYVGDDGIYIPSHVDMRYHTRLISRELFVEAYNKWIRDAK